MEWAEDPENPNIWRNQPVLYLPLSKLDIIMAMVSSNTSAGVGVLYYLASDDLKRSRGRVEPRLIDSRGSAKLLESLKRYGLDTSGAFKQSTVT